MDDSTYCFIAPDDAAAPAASWPIPAEKAVFTRECDARDSVVEWEGLPAGVATEDLVRAGEPREVIEMKNDGHDVFIVSERLQRHLREAHPVVLRRVASAWSDLRAADGDDVDDAEAFRIMSEVSALARAAAARGAQRYGSGF